MTPINRITANAILGLQAQTSIHAGTGQNTGIIDLPIQREGHNGWPCIFGSSVKGALRIRAEQHYGATDNKVIQVFGPDTDNASEHAGALAVSDARLLLFPVRSLTSHFKWLTCPAVIERYCNDCLRFDYPLDMADSLQKITDYFLNESKDDSNALIPETKKPSTTENTENNTLFLEEYQFKTEKFPLDLLLAELSKSMSQSEAVLQRQLVIVNNDMFTHLVQHGTPVNAHIAIDSGTKIVKPGALWYQETLPPETLLYIGLSATSARKKDSLMVATEVLQALTDLFTEREWLQVGGNETLGMGWCKVSKLKQEA